MLLSSLRRPAARQASTLTRRAVAKEAALWPASWTPAFSSAQEGHGQGQVRAFGNGNANGNLTRATSITNALVGLNQRQIRCASSSSAGTSTSTKVDLKDDDHTLSEEARVETHARAAVRRWAGAGYAVGGVAILGTSWFAMKYIAYTIGAIYSQPHIIAYIGFWCGFLSTSAAAGVAFGLYRMTHIRPENVFRQTSTIIKNNLSAQRLLGKQIRTAKLKSYEITGGNFGALGGPSSSDVDKVNGTIVNSALVNNLGFGWKPHVCQMTYLVYGEHRMGLVTAKCTKIMSLVPGRLSIDLLALDVLDDNMLKEGSETLMLHGSKEDLQNKKDSIYNMLELKKNHFVQSKASTTTDATSDGEGEQK